MIMAIAPDTAMATTPTNGSGSFDGQDEKSSSPSRRRNSNEMTSRAEADRGGGGANEVTDDDDGDVCSLDVDISNGGNEEKINDDEDSLHDKSAAATKAAGADTTSTLATPKATELIGEVPALLRKLPTSRPSVSSSSSSKQGAGANAYTDLSLEEEWILVDRLHKTLSKGVLVCWISLVILCYFIVPKECIQWYTGAERNAALVNLSILTTAVVTKHIPLLWEMNIKDMAMPSNVIATPSSSSSRQSGSEGGSRRGATKAMPLGRTCISGILGGGMVTQFIAIMTAAIMVCFPVPVMVDPILGSRVHLIRWCEWTPCAGFMTLMMDLVDAPQYDGEKFTHPWKTMFLVAGMESLSSCCALIFPFCTNFYVWMIVMTFSCVTYSAVLYRNYQKRLSFVTCRWRGGRNVDEVELYERARTSLALNFVCSVVWTMIVISYFVTSCGHMVLSERWTIFHDPAITMIGECSMDLLAKWLFMSLIVDAHNSIFDESKRAKRRLVELRNMMSVVWENSSDTIAISVRKISGNVTSMVSPSFFKAALCGMGRDKIQDISAVVLEHSSEDMKLRREAHPNKFPDVGIEVIRKADFDGVDFHFTGNNVSLGYIWQENKAMEFLVVAFTDMLARAWHNKAEEILFEYDTTAIKDGTTTIKFEVTLTRLEGDAIVLVVRNVSERYQRFEAEKRFIFETTARQRDAEANRFTRHEVKNCILAAIEICGNIHDQLSNNPLHLLKDSPLVMGNRKSLGIESVDELDRTLHEVLDIILAGTVCVDYSSVLPRMFTSHQIIV